MAGVESVGAARLGVQFFLALVFSLDALTLACLEGLYQSPDHHNFLPGNGHACEGLVFADLILCQSYRGYAERV